MTDNDFKWYAFQVISNDFKLYQMMSKAFQMISNISNGSQLFQRAQRTSNALISNMCEQKLNDVKQIRMISHRLRCFQTISHTFKKCKLVQMKLNDVTIDFKCVRMIAKDFK